MKAVPGAAAFLAALLCGPHLHAQQITGNELNQWLSEHKNLKRVQRQTTNRSILHAGMH